MVVTCDVIALIPELAFQNASHSIALKGCPFLRKRTLKRKTRVQKVYLAMVLLHFKSYNFTEPNGLAKSNEDQSLSIEIMLPLCYMVATRCNCVMKKNCCHDCLS